MATLVHLIVGAGLLSFIHMTIYYIGFSFRMKTDKLIGFMLGLWSLVAVYGLYVLCLSV